MLRILLTFSGAITSLSQSINVKLVEGVYLFTVYPVDCERKTLQAYQKEPTNLARE